MTNFIHSIKRIFGKSKPVPKQKTVRLTLSQKFPDLVAYRNELIRLLIERVEKNLAEGEIEKAINRYEGFFKHHPEDQNIHNRVAELYLKTGNKIKAGRHLYFKEQLSEEELACVKAFEAWCGNSVRTAKYVMYKDNFGFSKLNNYSQEKFRLLILAASEEVGMTPKFLQAYARHFEKSAKTNNKSTI